MFVVFLLKSYLRQTELVRYVEEVFATAFEKMCVHSAVPKEKRLSFEHDSYEGIVYQSKEKYVDEILQLNEVMIFCEELFETIVQSLVFMPKPALYLIKAIWTTAIELVSCANPLDPRERNQAARGQKGRR